jgi:hypothetical protein
MHEQSHAYEEIKNRDKRRKQTATETRGRKKKNRETVRKK